ncbi:hypothetical protein FA10DRAFT_265002 [Acaromyces ingoldii]|uniref:Uncharacterized protein n=1 Tax=Acaromyces ingoldii TaxID=215250 RepID=A0A316YPA9_9BASI|nr:hypothetical protein FA10DRAFT_265002 [Acaromyces ingoldii]PWN91119.1 hypothetical protein FA10DRAFT_265002 [Acaromyces ingoldii]
MSSPSSEDGWSSSGSSSRSRSSSPSRSASPSPSTSASASASGPGAGEPRKRHGEKLRYEPPDHFVPADLTSYEGEGGTASGAGTELWAIKVPASLDVAALDGLSVPLASLEAGLSLPASAMARIKGAGGRRYTLRSTRAAVSDAHGAGAGAAALQDVEMASMHVLEPAPEKGPGRYALSRRGIDRTLHFTLDVGHDSDDDAAQRQQSSKRKREQPWDRLTGYFHPAGSSLSTALESEKEQQQQQARPPDSQTSTSSSPRKKKARKSKEQ